MVPDIRPELARALAETNPIGQVTNVRARVTPEFGFPTPIYAPLTTSLHANEVKNTLRQEFTLRHDLVISGENIPISDFIARFVDRPEPARVATAFFVHYAYLNQALRTFDRVIGAQHAEHALHQFVLAFDTWSGSLYSAARFIGAEYNIGDPTGDQVPAVELNREVAPVTNSKNRLTSDRLDLATTAAVLDKLSQEDVLYLDEPTGERLLGHILTTTDPTQESQLDLLKADPNPFLEGKHIFADLHRKLRPEIDRLVVQVNS